MIKFNIKIGKTENKIMNALYPNEIKRKSI